MQVIILDKRLHFILMYLMMYLFSCDTLISPSPPTACYTSMSAQADFYGDPLPAGAHSRLGTIRLRHNYRVKAVDLSPDGKIVASGGADFIVRLWDSVTGKELHKLIGHKMAIHSLAFSPDGRLLASSSGDKKVIIWNVHSGELVASFLGHHGQVYCLSFSPNGDILASGSADNSIRLWDVHARKELSTLHGHNGYVAGLCFSLDGNLLASIGGDNYIRIWDPKSRTAVSNIPLRQGPPGPISFSPSGRNIAYGHSDNTIRLFDITGNKECLSIVTNGIGTRSLAYSRDDKIIASGGEDGIIRTWDPRSGQEIRKYIGHLGPITSLTISNDSKILVSGSEDGTLRLWNIHSAEERITFISHQGAVTALQYSPDGRMLASGASDRNVIIWDTTTFKPIIKYGGHRSVISSITFSPDGHTLLSGDWNGDIHIYDTHLYRTKDTVSPRESCVESIFYVRHGNSIICTYYDNCSLSYDMGNGNTRLIMYDGGEEAHDVKASVDNNIVAFLRDDNVDIWSLGIHHRLLSIKIAAHSALAIAISPDGRDIVVTDKFNNMRIYEMASGKIISHSRGPGIGHNPRYSPRGNVIASSSDEYVSLIDAYTGRYLAKYVSDGGAIQSIAFSPDGSKLAAGLANTTILIWDVTKNVEPRKVGGTIDDINKERFWEGLISSDMERVAEAINQMSAGDAGVATYLGEKMNNIRGLDMLKKEASAAMRDLDNDRVDIREAAFSKVKSIGPMIDNMLREALRVEASIEVRERIEELLNEWARPMPIGDSETLRRHRVIRILERMATRESRRELERIKSDSPIVRERNEAAKALGRLENGIK